MNALHENPGTEKMSGKTLLYQQRLKITDKSKKFRAKATHFL